MNASFCKFFIIQSCIITIFDLCLSYNLVILEKKNIIENLIIKLERVNLMQKHIIHFICSLLSIFLCFSILILHEKN